MLFGRVGAGKTTLTQALRGEEIKYYKTQYVNYLDTVIDTPGEYEAKGDERCAGTVRVRGGYRRARPFRQRTVFHFLALLDEYGQSRGDRDYHGH